ncbi:hypothetical protein PCE1_001401 [Barthelona sp. PCE]
MQKDHFQNTVQTLTNIYYQTVQERDDSMKKLQFELSEKHEQLSAHQREIGELRRQNKLLQEELQKSHQQTSAMQAKYANLKRKIADLSDDHTEFNLMDTSTLNTSSYMASPAPQPLKTPVMDRTPASIYARTPVTATQREMPATGAPVDAHHLYRQIQRVLDEEKFKRFSAAIRDFNSQVKTSQEVMGIVYDLLGQDNPFLYEQFGRLLESMYEN